MTTEKKGYPFEVEMADGGIILVDQLRTLDWKFRNAHPKDTAPADVLKQVRVFLGIILQI